MQNEDKHCHVIKNNKNCIPWSDENKDDEIANYYTQEEDNEEGKSNFSNWKNAVLWIEKHENSRDHKKCFLKLKERVNVLERIN